MRKVPLERRFWGKVSVLGLEDCWPWKASLRKPKGYGQIGADGNRRVLQAHRVAWELTNGPIPDGLYVLHRCDNPPCVNPAHLFLGSAVDNAYDAIKKGRLGKLTQGQVDGIKGSTGRSGVELACLYGVSRSHVSRIRAGKCCLLRRSTTGQIDK